MVSLDDNSGFRRKLKNENILDQDNIVERSSEDKSTGICKKENFEMG